MESSDRIFDTMLREEFRKLNAHLPESRRTLKELLAEAEPSVPTVDGGRIVMRRSELEDFALSLPEEIKERVKLPLVLLRRTELGLGAFTLLGDAPEEYALSKIVKGFEGTYEQFRNQQEKPGLFYKPQISELLRKFHSLIVIGFGVQLE